MLLRHNGTRIEATLTQHEGRPALLLAGSALLLPTGPALEQYILVQASAEEVEALKQAGFTFSAPGQWLGEGYSSPPPDDDDPLF